MTLLLDTHVVPWWLEDNDTLDVAAEDRLDVKSEVLVSSVQALVEGLTVMTRERAFSSYDVPVEAP